jgi:Cupin domain
MRFPVDAQTAVAVVEGEGRQGGGPVRNGPDGRRRAHPALDSALMAEVSGCYMDVLPVGGARETGRAEPGIDSFFYVVAGRARVVIEGRSCIAVTGETFVVRAGESYRLSNAGDSEMRALEMRLPVRLDRPVVYPDTCSDEGQSRRTEE